MLSGHIESAEAARKARALSKTFGPALIDYWGISKEDVSDDLSYRIILGPIDDSGKTISDPVLIDGFGNIISDKLVDGVPYIR